MPEASVEDRRQVPGADVEVRRLVLRAVWRLGAGTKIRCGGRGIESAGVEASSEVAMYWNCQGQEEGELLHAIGKIQTNNWPHVSF